MARSEVEGFMSFLKDRFKQPGLPASVGLHSAVLLASVMTFSAPKPLPDAVEAVSVEVIDESQVREVTKGEQSAKQAAPTPRVDRVSPKLEQNAPGEAQKQVNADATPKPQEATAKEERKEVAAVVVPPPPLRPVIPPKPVEPPKPVAVAPAKPAPSKEEEKEEEAEEAIRQAAKKKLEQQKLEQQRAEEQKKKLEEQKKLADQKKKLEEQERKEEEAERQEELREAAEAKKREEQKKVADAKAAADAKKAEDAKKAQEAAKKAAAEAKKREADQQARNQAAADSARRALLASREAPSNSGNTGQQISRTPAAGAATATGAKLNPSDRAALAGMLADQINKCWNIPVSGRPNPLPQVRISLGADGSLQGAPVLVNSSGDANFRALAESGMRAIRQCSPFRIPARFAATHGDWRSTIVQLNPED
jgi:colicin import membrane protein